jgi:hypothetical protein
MQSAPLLSFDVPQGRLAFSAGDLDVWAEHLSWCLSFQGVPAGATVAVQDFGSSPLSFLGSALLMPGLKAGIAERLQGRFIGLDASAERVALTSGVLSQADPDVLIVRGAVLPLLLQMVANAGMELERDDRTIIVSFDRAAPALPQSGAWHELWHVESSLLLAPKCPECRCFHLRERCYALEDDRIANRHLDVPTVTLPPGARVLEVQCGAGAQDRLIRFADGPAG